MMRSRDPQTREDGFHWLLPQAPQHAGALIEEFLAESDSGLRAWLLELIAAARSQEALPLLRDVLYGEESVLRLWAIRALKQLDTREARTLLWEARDLTFSSPEETATFRAELGERGRASG